MRASKFDAYAAEPADTCLRNPSAQSSQMQTCIHVCTHVCMQSYIHGVILILTVRRSDRDRDRDRDPDRGKDRDRERRRKDRGRQRQTGRQSHIRTCVHTNLHTSVHSCIRACMLLTSLPNLANYGPRHSLAETAVEGAYVHKSTPLTTVEAETTARRFVTMSAKSLQFLMQEVECKGLVFTGLKRILNINPYVDACRPPPNASL